MKKLINKLANKIGYNISRFPAAQSLPLDIAKEEEFLMYYNECREFSMTTIERMYALYRSVNYVIDNQIPGDFVECGVWRGGSAMMMAKILKGKKIEDKKIYLYDTYDGMSEPTDVDRSFKGSSAADMLEKQDKAKQSSVWCYASLDEVKNNLSLTAYPVDMLVFVRGKVEDTIPGKVPEKISILRLDTDWYESTRHELDYLYPLLSQNGVLIIDDYGHWDGARKAVDEYFVSQKKYPFLNRVDYTCRLNVKG